MEDIKNIENAKARAETFMKNRKNKKRNEKYTPGFIEMAVKFLNKTPAEAGLFDASPRSAKALRIDKTLLETVNETCLKVKTYVKIKTTT
jgi:hypothetical protein